MLMANMAQRSFSILNKSLVVQKVMVLIPTSKLQSHEGNETLRRHIVKKLNQGLFAETEIWMTDLCMEPEAESKCDELITQSLTIDDSNPESWSLLASIRISQQRDEDASEAISKAWDLFEAKKTALEDNTNINTGDLNSEDLSNEYVELPTELNIEQVLKISSQFDVDIFPVNFIIKLFIIINFNIPNFITQEL